MANQLAGLPCVVAIALSTTLPAQVTWWQVPTTTAPGASFATAVAEAPGGRMLQFGGYDSVRGWNNETWLFDGTAWQQAPTPTGMANRSGHKLAFDLVRQRTVLFGGNNSNSLAETWEWDGALWTRITPAQSPSPRTHSAMAFDLARNRMVVYGGSSVFNANLGDTWEYDGQTWIPIATNAQPGRRHGHGLAYDLGRNRIVMFGGENGTPFNDTWEYDGVDWTLRTPANAPSPRLHFGMTYDWSRAVTVVAGGALNIYTGETGDTWEWDGTDWNQRTPLSTVPARRNAAMTFLLSWNRSVLWGGGVGSNGVAVVNETWTYGGAAQATVTSRGQGCAGSAGVPSLAAANGQLPWLGSTWGASVTALPPTSAAVFVIGVDDASWNGAPLPLELSVFGMPGCHLQVRPDLALLVLGSNGSATLPIPLPANLVLLGVTFHLQAGSLDPLANAGGMTVSNALRATLGGR